MQDAVQNSGGNGDVGKDLVPLGESLVGGKDCGGLLVASGDELEEQIRTLNIHRKVSNLINDEHPVLGQDLELVREPVLKVGLFQLRNERMAVDVVSRKTMLRGHKAEGGGQMGLAHAGRPEEDYILPVFQKAHGGQLVDLTLVNGGLEGEIKVVQGLLDGETGHLDLLLISPVPLGFGFLSKDMV